MIKKLEDEQKNAAMSMDSDEEGTSSLRQSQSLMDQEEEDDQGSKSKPELISESAESKKSGQLEFDEAPRTPTHWRKSIYDEAAPQEIFSSLATSGREEKNKP